MVDRNELWAQTEDLADLIIRSPEIQRYQDAEAQLQAHSEVQRLMLRLRDLQDEIGDFITRKVPEQYYQHSTQEVESLLERLERIPEVQRFQSAQAAINELLQTISNHLQSAVLEQVAPEQSG